MKSLAKKKIWALVAAAAMLALSAALLAGWGSGMIARGEVPTPREAAAYAPTPALAARAEAAYRRYRRLYAALKPLFSDE